MRSLSRKTAEAWLGWASKWMSTFLKAPPLPQWVSRDPKRCLFLQGQTPLPGLGLQENLSSPIQTTAYASEQENRDEGSGQATGMIRLKEAI